MIAKRELADRINVFPVPDADTGSNLAATMDAAARVIGRCRARRRVAEMTRARVEEMRHPAFVVAQTNATDLAQEYADGLTVAFPSSPVLVTDVALAIAVLDMGPIEPLWKADLGTGDTT